MQLDGKAGKTCVVGKSGKARQGGDKGAVGVWVAVEERELVPPLPKEATQRFAGL